MPTFSPTSYGALSRMMCVDLGNVLLAFTACQWRSQENETYPLWLVLYRGPDKALGPSKPLYYSAFQYHNLGNLFRLAVVPNEYLLRRSKQLGPREFHIALWHITPKNTSPVPVALRHTRIPTPFRMTWETLRDSFGTFEHGWSLESAPSIPLNWTGTLPVAFHFRYHKFDGNFKAWFVLGLCPSEPGQHYASLYFHSSNQSPQSEQYLAHDCEWDHVSKWPEGCIVESSTRRKIPNGTRP